MKRKKIFEFEKVPRVFISIGSNTPDKDIRIRRALERLKAEFEDFHASDIYETPCYNGKGPDYMNVVCSFATDIPQSELELIFKHLETTAGRTADSRETGLVCLDIDVVVYDGTIVRQRDFMRNYFRKGYLQLCDPKNLRIKDYFYDLPDDRIASHPLADRDSCRLIVADRHAVIADTTFRKVGDFLANDSLLIYNDTRVINARLRFTKETGSSIEIFCLEPAQPADYQLNFASSGSVQWHCLVGNSKRWKSGSLAMNLTVGGKPVKLTAQRIDRSDEGSLIEFSWDDADISFSEIISAAGVIPIPPYLNRDTEDSDASDYQTVYSRCEGSVAAPTAGLHFTDNLLESLRDKGMQTRGVTLHVGAGTFRPVKSDDVGHHEMHRELIDVRRDLISELAVTKRPVTAVGTTTVRTLESLYHIGCKMAAGEWDGQLDQWYPYSENHPELSVKESLEAILKHLDAEGCDRLIASTGIIIAPSYRFRIVDNLITNFHQPGSTLLLLVAAIVGQNWRDIYSYALLSGYRFLSYGDACLLLGLKH